MRSGRIVKPETEGEERVRGVRVRGVRVRGVGVRGVRVRARGVVPLARLKSRFCWQKITRHVAWRGEDRLVERVSQPLPVKFGAAA